LCVTQAHRLLNRTANRLNAVREADLLKLVAKHIPVMKPRDSRLPESNFKGCFSHIQAHCCRLNIRCIFRQPMGRDFFRSMRHRICCKIRMLKNPARTSKPFTLLCKTLRYLINEICTGNLQSVLMCHWAIKHMLHNNRIFLS
jgi:hypothetical protein